MPHQHLSEALEALHHELASTAELEPEDRAALVRTMQEIHEALGRFETPTESSSRGTLSGRISGLIEDLETSHPRFAELLGNVSESLSNMGI